MRELTIGEVSLVAGGTDSVSAARNICRNNNLPANTAVTITMGTSANLGAGGSGTGVSQSVTIETTCGALTGAADFSGVSVRVDSTEELA